MNIENKLGGRGKCQFCGEWENNVSYHEAWECLKNPHPPFFPGIKRASIEQKERLINELVLGKKSMKCVTHSKYKAINRPDINCDDCWRAYFERHPADDNWRELLTSLKKFGENLLKSQCPEIVGYPFRRGDKVTVNYDIRDSYGDIYICKGHEVTVGKVIPEQKGYEFQIDYGFCVGADALTKV